VARLRPAAAEQSSAHGRGNTVGVTLILDRGLFFLVDIMTDSVTDLVNIDRGGNLLQDAVFPFRSGLVRTVDCFDSEGWFSCNYVIFYVFCVFVGKTARSV